MSSQSLTGHEHPLSLPGWCCTRPSACLPVMVVSLLLVSVGAGVPRTLLPALGILFPLLSPSAMRAFAFCFVEFGCCFLETSSFLMGMNLGERRWGCGELGGVKRGEIMVRTYCMREKSILNFLKNVLGI